MRDEVRAYARDFGDFGISIDYIIIFIDSSWEIEALAWFLIDFINTIYLLKNKLIKSSPGIEYKLNLRKFEEEICVLQILLVTHFLFNLLVLFSRGGLDLFKAAFTRIVLSFLGSFSKSVNSWLTVWIVIIKIGFMIFWSSNDALTLIFMFRIWILQIFIYLFNPTTNIWSLLFNSMLQLLPLFIIMIRVQVQFNI